MSAGEIHQGDTGTVFRQIIKNQSGSVVDISGATTTTIKFMKPDRSVVSKTAIFYTDGTDGIIQYTTIAGDLNMAGTWKRQGFATLPAWTGHSDVVEFKVYPNLS